MGKIIVTGATSMIGSALIEVAVREGIEVFAILRPDTKRIERLTRSELVHPIYCTLECLHGLTELPDNCEVFYHFAWEGTGRTDRDNPIIHERNIKYTLDAVELASRCGCRRFVGAGSQAEYGPVYGMIDDETKCEPILSYGVAKYAAGILSKRRCVDLQMDHVWGRIFSVYGPNDNSDTMLDYAIKCFIKGETARLSAATHYWNYLYESDAGEMFYILGQKSTLPGNWVVANNKSQRLKEYIQILLDVYGPSARVLYADQGELEMPGLNINAGRVKIPCLPKVNFEEGIRKMIDAKREQKSFR